MKITAIALLIATATISLPAQASDFTTKLSRGQVTLSFSANDHHRSTKPVPHKKHLVKQRIRHNFVPLSPRRVANILHHRGYSDLRNMRTDGRIYTLQAHNRRGHTERLTVSAHNGKILKHTTIHRMGHVAPRTYRTPDSHRTHTDWAYNRDRKPFWLR